MNLELVAAVARAVLYEGYILYPYRPSSAKNRQRWTFGGVFPADYVAHDASERCLMQTQCLLRPGAEAVLEVRVRFLHALLREIGKAVEPASGGAVAFANVASLEVDGRRLLAWEESVEREIASPVLTLAGLVNAPARIPFAFAATQDSEPLMASDGGIAGLLICTALAVTGFVGIAAEAVGDGAFRLTVRVENTTPLGPAEAADRDTAQRSAFASTHTILGVHDGEFLSLLDPPGDMADAAAACVNEGTWPVLAGDPDRRNVMLSSPIILYDYPQIAPESPGDLFDGTEIDEILTLRILAMTDDEKRDMAATDHRARALLERTEALTPAELGRLHGALRYPGDASVGLRARSTSRRPP